MHQVARPLEALTSSIGDRRSFLLGSVVASGHQHDWAAALLLGALPLFGCSGTGRPSRTPPSVPRPIQTAEPVAEPEPNRFADDVAVISGELCDPHRLCDGDQMCRAAGECTEARCGPSRECGPDQIAYCDCDHTTFYAPEGCPGRSFLHRGPCDLFGVDESHPGIPDGDEPFTAQDRTCNAHSDCPSRTPMCLGPPGCGAAFRCQRARGCTRDRVPFCGCDGQTFYASSTCPGQPYLRSGSCETGTVLAEAPVEDPVPHATSPETARQLAAPQRDLRAPPTEINATPRPPASQPAEALAEPNTSVTRTCLTNRDCAAGLVCTGPDGCDQSRHCERPQVRCSRDTQYFCGCDGATFRASMNCPGRAFAHRGSCG